MALTETIQALSNLPTHPFRPNLPVALFLGPPARLPA